MSDRYESQCKEASQLLTDHFGYGVGLLCVADGIRVLLERPEAAVAEKEKTLKDRRDQFAKAAMFVAGLTFSDELDKEKDDAPDNGR